MSLNRTRKGVGANEFKKQSSDKIRSVFQRDHSACLLEGGFKDGKSGGKDTSERGLVQMRSNAGLRKGQTR